MLPLGEIVFTDPDPNFWPIVTYDAKWKPETRDYKVTPPQYPTLVARRLAERVDDLARKAFRLLGCRDYARVDFRVRGSRPYILEVNPNPDISPMAGLCNDLEAAGLSPARFMTEIVQAAAARGLKGCRDRARVEVKR